jgi:hypothetical protein
MLQQLLSVILLILIGGGCAIAAPAWPNGYREAACTATDHLRAADGAFAEAADGIAAGDADRVAIAAAGMERASDDALDALDGAPNWAPGAQLPVELRAAAIAFARAASEFGVGARQGDGPGLDRAVASAQDGEAALARADQEGERLRNAIGWKSC